MLCLESNIVFVKEHVLFCTTHENDLSEDASGK